MLWRKPDKITIWHYQPSIQRHDYPPRFLLNGYEVGGEALTTPSDVPLEIPMGETNLLDYPKPNS